MLGSIARSIRSARPSGRPPGQPARAALAAFSRTARTALAALALAALAGGTAGADPSHERLAGRVEEQLSSDGISLARLGQTIALAPEGGGLRVTLSERAGGKPPASRLIEKLPADDAAAVAQIKGVVAELLRERGLLAARRPGEGWTATFGPAAVTAYHRPAAVAVVAAGVSPENRTEARAAAAALLAAYRAAGVARVDDAQALGEIGQLEDPAVVTRAAGLPVEHVAILRVFPDGAGARGVVTLYSKTGQLVAGFSAAAGQALVAPASRGVEGGIADQIMRDRPAEPAPDKDGVVRIWIRSKDPQVQLLSTDTARVVAGGKTGDISIHHVLCRAPCGTVIDGSLGGEYVFGGKGIHPSDRFQLIKMKGDVTATVQPGSASGRFGGAWLMYLGGSGITVGATMLLLDRSFEPVDPDLGEEPDHTLRNFSIGAIVVGAAALIGGVSLYTSSATTYTFKPGRPE